MIIVEGCDNTGKSTLILSLATDLRMATARSNGRPRSKLAILHYHGWCEDCPQDILLDRHPALSDLVYGSLLRNFTHSDLGLAHRVIEDHFLIYCRPPTSKVIANILDREQMEGVTANAIKLLQGYDDLMSLLQPDFTYDYTQPKAYEELKNAIKSTAY